MPKSIARVLLNALFLWASLPAIILSIIFVDRPLVRVLHANVRHTAAWSAIDAALRIVPALLAVLVLSALAVTIAQRSGWIAPRWTADLRIAAEAAVAALVTAELLQVLFGRSWPDPTFTDRGVYDFRWSMACGHHTTERFLRQPHLCRSRLQRAFGGERRSCVSPRQRSRRC